MKYVVVLERGEGNWAAYSPDVLGCIATGRTPAMTLKRYQSALRMHFAGLKEDGLPLPKPSARISTVEVQVWEED